LLPEITIVDNMAVYWLGPTLGALAAMYSAPTASKILKASTSCLAEGFRWKRGGVRKRNEQEDYLF
jgi:hypothetical protein